MDRWFNKAYDMDLVCVEMTVDLIIALLERDKARPKKNGCDKVNAPLCLTKGVVAKKKIRL